MKSEPSNLKNSPSNTASQPEPIRINSDSSNRYGCQLKWQQQTLHRHHHQIVPIISDRLRPTLSESSPAGRMRRTKCSTSTALVALGRIESWQSGSVDPPQEAREFNRRIWLKRQNLSTWGPNKIGGPERSWLSSELSWISRW